MFQEEKQTAFPNHQLRKEQCVNLAKEYALLIVRLSFTAVTMKNAVFWDVMSYSLVEIYWRLGWTCHSIFIVEKVLYPEEGGMEFLPFIGKFVQDYMVS